ncbi:MAG: quaternary ammonium compound efflux SMR transporter SugE [Coxiellaceae bacterium]|nr:quaternary ammonium compound efflux SMR transporter SugE [Coxiellaceae bacterium]
MTWLALFVAGLFETGWAVGLKYTEGWTRLWPSIYTLIAMAISFFLLSYALKTLPIGTAYAIWTGIGAVGAVLFGIFFLHEPAGALRILCIAVIIAGMIGLKLTSGH